MKYSDILKQAKSLKTSVEKDQKFNINSKWIYYICKAIIKQADVKSIDFDKAPNPTGTYISRSVYKEDYMEMVEHLIDFVESRNRLPNFIKVAGKNVRVRDYGYAFARILIYIDNHKEYPNYVNINSKAYTKPTETGNVVYDYVTKKTGRKFKTIDDVLEYVQQHGRYIFEFDDVRSNKQVTDCFCGNCTDWLQWLWNMAEAMGYDCRAVHVKCRVSGTGHVRGQFKHPKNTGGQWIDRDPAAVADGGSITSIWCSDGYVLATNPSWFMANLNR